MLTSERKLEVKGVTEERKWSEIESGVKGWKDQSIKDIEAARDSEEYWCIYDEIF